MTRRKTPRRARETSAPLSLIPGAPSEVGSGDAKASLPSGARFANGGGDDSQHPWLSSRLVGLAIVVAVALGLYWRASSFGFVYVDDDQLIVEERAEHLSNGTFWNVFSQPYFRRGASDHAYYRPLVTATFVVDAQLGQLDSARSNDGSKRDPAHAALDPSQTNDVATSYHRTNLVLHALAVGLLYCWLRQGRVAGGWAILLAAMFAVHPGLTESVAWIPGRPDVLLTVFALGAWLLHRHALRTNNLVSRILHCVAWLFALWSKEAALVLPALWCIEAYLTRSPERPLVERRVLLGWALVLSSYLIGRRFALPNGFGVGGVTTTNVITNLPVLLSSLGKLCLPLQLSVLATPEDTWLWPGIVVVFALGSVARLVPSLRQQLAFALAAYAITMLPSLPATRTLILESRLYLPLVPLIGLVGSVAQTVSKRARTAKAWGPALGIALVLLLAWRTHGYLDSFRDRRSFTLAAVEGSPHSALAHRNLGVYYHLEHKIEAAQREYQTALRLDPTQTVAHNNLGVIYMAQAKLAEAERELRDELSINPRYAEAHHNLALILQATGRDAQAVRHWSDILTNNPRDVTALQALIKYYASRDLAQAEYYRKRLIAQQPPH